MYKFYQNNISSVLETSPNEVGKVTASTINWSGIPTSFLIFQHFPARFQTISSPIHEKAFKNSPMFINPSLSLFIWYYYIFKIFSRKPSPIYPSIHGIQVVLNDISSRSCSCRRYQLKFKHLFFHKLICSLINHFLCFQYWVGTFFFSIWTDFSWFSLKGKVISWGAIGSSYEISNSIGLQWQLLLF